MQVLRVVLFDLSASAGLSQSLLKRAQRSEKCLVHTVPILKQRKLLHLNFHNTKMTMDGQDRSGYVIDEQKKWLEINESYQ